MRSCAGSLADDDIDDFLLSLPLGSGKAAAALEAAIAERLHRSEHEKQCYKDQVQEWCAAADPKYIADDGAVDDAVRCVLRAVCGAW